MQRGAQGGQISLTLHDHAQQKTENGKTGAQEVQSVSAPPYGPQGDQVIMPRKTNTDKDKRGNRRPTENRTPRPKPKIDFTEDALDFKNTNLLKQYVTDQGRILPRKYTGMPAHYQRRLTNAIKRARQMLLMK